MKVPKDHQMIFEPTATPNLQQFASIVDHETAYIIVHNTSSWRILVRKNPLMGQASPADHYAQAFLVDYVESAEAADLATVSTHNPTAKMLVPEHMALEWAFTVVTHDGQHTFYVPILGYKGSNAYVQRRMDNILRGSNADAYCDDIVIASSFTRLPV
ncbi:hypothetical protein UVI_02010570 [Ustilaginoidea virens]|uniref:Uncharacterized protein n=1 Tax=Ustilaginoidea virens TaxID=1159556 RepID=A0A1B5KWI8_USTVR|nr:hypothetical protein UVI_02010570 [Ustilaginoidea virens]